jgi:glucose-6-phosphate dehydrogenase assembly protein OpcA
MGVLFCGFSADRCAWQPLRRLRRHVGVGEQQEKVRLARTAQDAETGDAMSTA